VAEQEGKVLGGAGIFPSEGLPEGTCELVKNVPDSGSPEYRIRQEINRSMPGKARETGYQQVYLETLPELKQAVKVYEKFGFDT